MFSDLNNIRHLTSDERMCGLQFKVAANDLGAHQSTTFPSHVNYFLIKSAKILIGIRKKWTPVLNRGFQLLPASVHGTPRLSTTGSTILSGKVMLLSLIHSLWWTQFNWIWFFLKGKRWCSIYRSWALCRSHMTVASVVYRCGCTRTAGGPTDATGVVSGRIRRNQRRRVNGRTAFSPTLGSATADIHWPNW